MGERSERGDEGGLGGSVEKAQRLDVTAFTLEGGAILVLPSGTAYRVVRMSDHPQGDSIEARVERLSRHARELGIVADQIATRQVFP